MFEALPDTDALRALIEVERDASLWGQPQRITPRLVSEVLGDGKQLIYLCPIMTRPNYYVARIDSAHSLDDTDEWLEPLLQMLEAEYTNADDEGYEDERPDFPAFHDGGESWGPETLADYAR